MKTLVVLTGPTGVGKTELSLRIAEKLGSPIINCDSRQVYKEMPTGTAAPTQEQLSRVKHYFVGTKSIHEPYSAAKYETEALQLLESLFSTLDTIVVTGGSMLYIDALCKGIDDMPDISPEIRQRLQLEYQTFGLAPLLKELEACDPVYHQQVDQNNYKRVIHGLEIFRQTHQPFSSFRKETAKIRPFQIVKICINRDRAELYRRIDERVEQMVLDGFEQEARNLYAFRHLNALNTVGYKEFFAYFDGTSSLKQTISSIQFNTHKYARKQLTWFKKDTDYHWFHPTAFDKIMELIEQSGEKGLI